MLPVSPRLKTPYLTTRTISTADMADTQMDTDSTDFSDGASTFGDRIVAARQSMGMTAEDLAWRMGVKPATLISWEEDRSEPRANKLQMLAGVLNVSMVWLMSGEGQGLRAGEAAPEGADAMLKIIGELRSIREAQSDLMSRTRRLERRLLALDS